jgi:hypothetical protein
MNKDENPKRSLRDYLQGEDQNNLQKRLGKIQGNVRRPFRNDPRHGDESVRPGGVDVPAGGSTGEQMGGGSSQQRKGLSG